MKKLILIISLTSSINLFSQDYYEHKTDQELKEKKCFARNKIIQGVILFFLGVAMVSYDDNVENKKVVHIGGGWAMGVGIAMGADGIIETIEVNKVKRKRNKKQKL